MKKSFWYLDAEKPTKEQSVPVRQLSLLAQITPELPRSANFNDHMCMSELQLARQGNVFATDAILTTLMCCTRSSYPWDIVVQKVKDKIFLDKRDGSAFGMN